MPQAVTPKTSRVSKIDKPSTGASKPHPAGAASAAEGLVVEEVKPAKVRRLKRDERRQFFLEEAAKHFAKYGFSSSTPELAKSLGVAQSLLYKHYKSKDELILDVYTYLSPKPEMYDQWIAKLTDRSTPIRERLIDFYMSYAEETWGYVRVRILTWANLFKPDLSEAYYSMLEAKVFPAIALELRYAANRLSDERPTQRELEMVRALHGGMFHIAAFRRWINPPRRIPGKLETQIELKVDVFLRGAKDLLAWG